MFLQYVLVVLCEVFLEAKIKSFIVWKKFDYNKVSYQMVVDNDFMLQIFKFDYDGSFYSCYLALLFDFIISSYLYPKT